MCTLIQKFDVKAYNFERIEGIFKEVFYGTMQELVQLASPKVKNSAY